MLGTQIQSSTYLLSLYHVPGIAFEEKDNNLGQLPLKLGWVMVLVSSPLGIYSFTCWFRTLVLSLLSRLESMGKALATVPSLSVSLWSSGWKALCSMSPLWIWKGKQCHVKEGCVWPHEWRTFYEGGQKPARVFQQLPAFITWTMCVRAHPHILERDLGLSISLPKLTRC